MNPSKLAQGLYAVGTAAYAKYAAEGMVSLGAAGKLMHNAPTHLVYPPGFGDQDWRAEHGDTYETAMRVKRKAEHLLSLKAPKGQKARKVLSKELKYVDTDLDIGPTLTIGKVFDTCHAIPNGITDSERTGRTVVVHAINFRYTLTLPGSGTGGGSDIPLEGDIVRVLLFLDTQCNKAKADTTDIIADVSILSFNNLTNRNRFLVVYDKTHEINYTGLARGSSGKTKQAAISFHTCVYKKMATTISWANAFAGVSHMTSNNYSLLVISDKGVASFASKFRVRFTDF